MENTEIEDNFNTWIDIVKKHHPDLNITKELMDILFDTFSAGIVSNTLNISIDHAGKSLYERLH